MTKVNKSSFSPLVLALLWVDGISIGFGCQVLHSVSMEAPRTPSVRLKIGKRRYKGCCDHATGKANFFLHLWQLWKLTKVCSSPSFLLSTKLPEGILGFWRGWEIQQYFPKGLMHPPFTRRHILLLPKTTVKWFLESPIW